MVVVTIVVIPVVTVTVVVMGLVCAGEVIDTFVEVLTVAMRVDVMIVVSNVAVDLLMDALTAIMLEVLISMDVNVFVGVMPAFEFAMSSPLENFRC